MAIACRQRLAAIASGLRRLCNIQAATPKTTTPAARYTADCHSPARNLSTATPAICAGHTWAGAQIKAEATFAIRNRRRGMPEMPATNGTNERITGIKRHSATL